MSERTIFLLKTKKEKEKASRTNDRNISAGEKKKWNVLFLNYEELIYPVCSLNDKSRE
jgi:hypothetical protein